MRIPVLEIALDDRKIRLHRPASNAADGDLEVKENLSAANLSNNRCLSRSALLNVAE